MRLPPHPRGLPYPKPIFSPHTLWGPPPAFPLGPAPCSPPIISSPIFTLRVFPRAFLLHPPRLPPRVSWPTFFSGESTSPPSLPEGSRTHLLPRKGPQAHLLPCGSLAHLLPSRFPARLPRGSRPAFPRRERRPGRGRRRRHPGR